MNEWRDGWMDEGTNEWMNEWWYKWINEWISGWRDTWMNEWMKGWMDEGVDECRWILSIIIQFLKPPALAGLRRAPCSKILMQHQHHIPPESSVTSRFVGITHQLYIACNEWIKHSTVPSLLFLILSLSCMCMLQISVNSRREDTVPCPTHGWVNSSYLCDVLMATLALVICAVTSSMTFVSVSTLTWNNHQTKLIKRLYMFSLTVSNQSSNVSCRCSPLYL